jgi:capsule polysaccharide export protein KpsE/RkpR
MTKALINSLFFNPTENPFKMEKATLNADMVEATINQLIAEINENLMRLQGKLKQFPDSNLIHGEIKGLKTALNSLRRLNSSITWKQVELNARKND